MINLFKKQPSKPPKTRIKKTTKDLSLLDDVWVLEEDSIKKGWVWDISRRTITVIYGESLEDYKFQIQKPLTATCLKQDNKILFYEDPRNDISDETDLRS